MNALKGRIAAIFMLAMILFSTASLLFLLPETVRATDTAQGVEAVDAVDAADDAKGDKAKGAGIAVGLAAAAGAVGMGIAVGKSVEGIARQPEAEGKIRTTLMLGLVFIETAIIYALIVGILIIFVL